MALLTLNVLGAPQVTRADGTALTFRSRKALALLVYLAVEGRQEHSRGSLLGLLWPEDPEEAARNSLRVALANLRQMLGAAADELLHISRASLRFVSDSDHALDVVAFSALLAVCRAHRHERADTCPECVARLTEAAALYRGEFLAGFALPASAPFQEWALVVREQLHQQALEALDTLATAAEQQGDYGALCRYARRQLALEPWREQAHRQLMHGLALAGDRGAALSQYAACCQVLEAELGIEPDAATHALYQQIRTGASAAPSAPLSAHPVQRAPLSAHRQHAMPSPPASFAGRGHAIGAARRAPRHPRRATPRRRPEHGAALGQIASEAPAPGPVYGRAQEVAQLRRLLIDERCQLVALLGIGGVGKTTLAATVAQSLGGHFDAVIWHSLLNAPRLDELLRQVLQSLAAHTLAELPASLSDQLALLLDYLRKQRCLLVLDNLESVLADDGAGEMRAGYEAYARLLHQLAHHRHRSCLLLTSRERPKGMARWETGMAWVRTLRLEGLDAQAAHAILSASGLRGQEAEAQQLVARYSGHPLALALVAETVQELFGGAIADFLRAETLIFDDIRALLDDQFARLGALEQEILFWLAIEREPISAGALSANLVRRPPPGRFLEALRALRRRSLLEQHGAEFTLQNVVIEYVTARLIDGVCAELADGRALDVDRTRALPLLTRFALLKAQAREYVRQSQARVILQPIADRLAAELGESLLDARIRAILDALRATAPRAPGYAAGNLLNLLVHRRVAVAGYNFSRLSVWQADLRGQTLAGMNIAEADLAGCAFTFDFSIYELMVDRAGHVLVAAPFRGGICTWRVSESQLHAGFRSRSAEEVSWLFFSPDGRTLAGCCPDGSVRLWSCDTGAELCVLRGHSAPAVAAAFSGDTRLVASISLDHTIRVWDAQRGTCLQVMRAQHPGYSPLVFRPPAGGERAAAGPILAGVGSDQTIYLWDASSGAVVDVLRGHAQTVQSLAFSPDGALLASGTYDGTILVWEVGAAGRARLLATLRTHSHIVRVLAFHPDSHLLASGSADRTIRLWDVHEGKVLQTLSGHTGEVTKLAFHPDGKTLISSSADRVLKLWDVQTGRALDSYSGYIDVVHAVRFRPGGHQLASAGADGLVRLWPGRPDAVERSLQAHVGPALALAYSPDGRLLASGGLDAVIQMWDADTGQLMYTLHGHTGAVKSLTFSPDGQLLASGGADRTIRLWPVTDRPALVVAHRGLVLDGHADEVAAVAFSPDGRLLVSSSHDHTARLWAVDSGHEVSVLRGHTGALCAAAFSPAGDSVATIGYDSLVQLWEVATGRSIMAWRGAGANGRVVGFSPRGDLLVHGSDELALVVRDVRTGQVVHTLRGHTSTIIGLDFSPAEPILASCGWDGTIRVWELETGRCRRSLRVPGPYAGMRIAGATGITAAQRAALVALGAVAGAGEA